MIALLQDPHDLINIARRIGLSLMSRKPEDGNLDMEEVMLRAEIADFQKMNEVRGRVDERVAI